MKKQMNSQFGRQEREEGASGPNIYLFSILCLSDTSQNYCCQSFPGYISSIVGMDKEEQKLIKISHQAPYFFFETGFSLCHRGRSAVLQSETHNSLDLWGSSNSSASASQVAGTTGTHHHTRLMIVFLVETGFHYVGQDVVRFLTSSDPPISASRGAGITDVRHHAQLIFVFLVEMGVLLCQPVWSQTPDFR